MGRENNDFSEDCEGFFEDSVLSDFQIRTTKKSLSTIFEASATNNVSIFSGFDQENE